MNIDMEWQLYRTVFESIMKKFGQCTVDMFASRLNHQIVPYVSYLPDDKA